MLIINDHGQNKKYLIDRLRAEGETGKIRITHVKRWDRFTQVWYTLGSGKGKRLKRRYKELRS